MEQGMSLVAYCGLYCPKCYKMTVSGAAASLMLELEAAKMKGASFFEDYPQLEQILTGLVNLRCNVFCREGGGNPDCPIKRCCKSHGFDGCWDCADYERCSNLKEQFVSNIRKIKKMGVAGFIEKSI